MREASRDSASCPCQLKLPGMLQMDEGRSLHIKIFGVLLPGGVGLVAHQLLDL